MFIPNTYQVYFTITAKGLVDKMHDEYNKFWNESRSAKAKALGMTPLEVSILASIVQAESVKHDERPVIAGLYINRLKNGIPLQADPTLVFASGDFNLKRVLNVHKEVDSPYNTYKNKGIPPGPITMPDFSSIKAVLNPETHNYLYFVANPKQPGYHMFANTYIAHIRNSKIYYRWINSQRLYR